MIRLFLCEARRQIRSIADLCEEFGVRRYRAKRVNQNDFFKIICFLLNIGVYLQCERGEGTVSPLIFVK